MIDFDDNLSKSHTQHGHFFKEKKLGGRWVHFFVIYRFHNHKGCILIIFSSSIVENIVFVYTSVFLNRITSFEQLKNNNNKYQNKIYPIRWLIVTTKIILTMHRITLKMLYSSQCLPYYLSFFLLYCVR